LQRSGWQYFLNERDGTQEQLTGYWKLQELVVHQIEITGGRGVRTVDNTSPGGASSVITRSAVNVKTVKELGRGCPGANEQNSAPIAELQDVPPFLIQAIEV